jgi:DNA-binding IclR family transcriptional regulator
MLKPKTAVEKPTVQHAGTTSTMTEVPGPVKARARAADAEDLNGSRSVRRALRIFELMLDRSEPVSITTIIEELDIPKSTAYELVRTLTDAEYIEASAKDRGLFLGRKLFQLGMAYRNRVDLLKDGSQIVEELRDVTGETVQFSVFADDHMQVLMKEEGIRSIRIISNIGSRVPVNWAAAGRLLVSDMSDEDLTRLLERTMRPSPTGRASMDVATVIEQVRTFRKLGYAVESNQANDHAGCVAAPVIDKRGLCVAAISVAVPEHRLEEPDRSELIKAVKAAAERLSRRLSGH